jgi:carbamate kinase
LSLVIALGGNALGAGTAAQQLATLRETRSAIAPLAREGEVRGGAETLITSAPAFGRALAGDAGTRIH